MVSFAELKKAKPSQFSAAADAFKTLATDAGDCVGKLDTRAGSLKSAWDGEDQQGGTAAVDGMKSESDKLSTAQTSLNSIGGHLQTLAEAVRTQKQNLKDAVESAADIPATVSGEGEVKIDWSQIDTKDMSGGDLSMLRQAKQAKVDKVQEKIDDAVTKATEADETAKSDISGITVDSAASGGTPPGSAIPSPGGDPKAVKKWWDGLSAAERQYVLANHPEKVGKLDGVPSVYRDIANRSVLNEEIAALEGAVEATAGGDTSDGSPYDVNKNKLEGLQDIRDRLDSAAGSDSGERAYLLMIDAEHHNADDSGGGKVLNGDGQAIVAIGNPDTADNVFTHVPGTSAGLEGIDPYNLERVDRMVADANQLDPDKQTAGIMWLGYDAPDAVNNAISPSYAQSAAGDLRTFQDGLHVTSENPSAQYTMSGHSYGSTVIGEADTTGDLKADRMVFAGSPGVRADSAAELSVGAENVYATTAENDSIRVVPDGGYAAPLGNSPVSEEFGGHVVSSDPGTDSWTGVSNAAHSQYWEDGNVARDNFAGIITGHTDDGQVQYLPPEEGTEPAPVGDPSLREN